VLVLVCVKSEMGEGSGWVQQLTLCQGTGGLPDLHESLNSHQQPSVNTLSTHTPQDSQVGIPKVVVVTCGACMHMC
jgi:hypothetical protein